MTSPSTDPENSTESSGPQAVPHRRGFLERPGRRRRLQRELARADKSNRELAREYDVDEKAIRAFKERHAETIADMAKAIDDEFAGLWIAQKTERLSEMEGLYEDGVSPRDRETKLSVLRHAAEELGQIPNRTTIDMALPVEVVMHIDGGEDV